MGCRLATNPSCVSCWSHSLKRLLSFFKAASDARTKAHVRLKHLVEEAKPAVEFRLPTERIVEAQRVVSKSKVGKQPVGHFAIGNAYGIVLAAGADVQIVVRTNFADENAILPGAGRNIHIVADAHSGQ